MYCSNTVSLVPWYYDITMLTAAVLCQGGREEGENVILITCQGSEHARIGVDLSQRLWLSRNKDTLYIRLTVEERWTLL